jgi:outer membrane protein TolC
MKKLYLATACFFLAAAGLQAGEEDSVTLRLTLKEAIAMAQARSVDAAVALNELKTAYWEYRTYRAEQLPEINFAGALPSYTKSYSPYQESDGSYTYVQSHWMGLNGKISIEQNIALTGGRLSFHTSLDFTRQMGGKKYNEFMSIPVGLTWTQPVWGVNSLKWKRRIEPVRYREAKAAYMERVEGVTLTAVSYFFSLLHAKESLGIAVQNLRNAGRLYDIAVAKRQTGHISESELMQLNLGALQAKGIVTEAQSNLNAQMFRLRSFLGLGGDETIEPVPPGQAPALRMPYGEVLEKAQENNSLARNILRRRMEADYAVATAKGNRRSINLYASVGYTGKDRTVDGAYYPLRSNQIVELGVNIPLVDWGKRKGKVKVAESNREVVLSKTRQEQMNFNQDIFLLVENFNNQAGQLEIARQADLIAARRYDLSIETFRIGKISILDLNDAQRSKDEARLKHIEELYKYWNYYYNIRSITLYDFLANRNLDAEFEEIARR